MNDAAQTIIDSLDFNLKLLFGLILLTGYLSVSIDRLFIPKDKFKMKDSWFDILTFGIFNYFFVLMFYYMALLIGLSDYGLHLLVILSAFIAPVSTGIFWYLIRVKVLKRWIIQPQPTSWDFFFLTKQPCFIRFHLNDGRWVGGYYAEHSHASLFPYNQDVYVEKICKIDPNTGQFIGYIEGSKGALINRSDCKFIEFMEVEDNGK